MAIGIDGGSPALAKNGNVTSVSTASFTRPAAGLLVAMVMCTSDSNPVVAGGGLTWTRQVQRVVGGAYAEIWTAPVTGSGSMTVTLTVTGSLKALGLKVDGVTGQHASAPIGNTGNNVATTNTLAVDGYTSSANNSRGFFAAFEDNGLGNPTVSGGDTGFPWTNTNGLADKSGIAIRKAANTATSGTVVTFGADAPGASAADWVWAALEIKPDALNAEIETTTIAAVTVMPTPGVTLGGEPVPPTIAATVALPAPTVSSGNNLVPATIAATVAMPPPIVTTEDVALVTPATIAATTALPAPDASGSGNAAIPAAIAATVAMPAPTVRVDADVMLSTIAVAIEMPAPVTTVPPLPGDQITGPGQIEWNGFLLGSGTPYSWQELQGWRDLPPWVSGNVDRPDSNGSYEGQPFLGERVINWSTLLKAPRDQVAQVLRDLQMATGNAQSSDEGSLVIWDLDDAEAYLVYAHLSNRLPGAIDMRARLGLMRGGLQWTCSDPAIYSALRASTPVPINVETDLLNNGNEASTRVTLRIPGSATTPQIENLTTDRVIAFDTVIADGEVLEIDVRTGVVTIGAVNHLNDLIEGSVGVQDFALAPGSNRLLYTAATGGTLMDVLWRHAST